MLGLPACAPSLPPCNRADVQQAYDAQGHAREDAFTLTTPCMERLVGDLKACYQEAK